MDHMHINNCRVCMGPHDEEIHGATLRIHTWLRREITINIMPWQPIVAYRHSDSAANCQPGLVIDQGF
jgi:hypothetical protein